MPTLRCVVTRLDLRNLSLRRRALFGGSLDGRCLVSMVTGGKGAASGGVLGDVKVSHDHDGEIWLVSLASRLKAGTSGVGVNLQAGRGTLYCVCVCVCVKITNG